MKSTHNIQNSAHHEVSLLLPWYVNKTLQAHESLYVKTHLKNCLLCRIELTHLQKLSASVCQTDDITPLALASFSQLKNRIYIAEQQPWQEKYKRAATGWFSRFRNWFSPVKPINRVSGYSSMVFATLLLFSFSVFMPHFLNTQQKIGNEFNTLSNTSDVSTHKDEIRIVFSDHAKQQQILQILSSIQGRIISGPSSHGVYKVRIVGEQMTSADIFKTIALLRENTNVVFAEPALSLFSPVN